MMLGFAYWGIVGILVTFISTVLYWLLPKQFRQPWGEWLIRHALKIFISYFKAAGLLILDNSALKRLANQPGPMIIAPNHLALWDAVFCIAQIPDLVCLMKGSILRNPVLGGGSRLAGYIPNDSTSQMLMAAAHRVKKGAKILLFPESTRTKTHAQWINPFKGGVALLAKYTAAPIIPVYIRSSSRFLEKDRPLFKMPDFPIYITLDVGQPIFFPKGESVESFRRQLEQHYIAELSKPHSLRRTTLDNPGKIL